MISNGERFYGPPKINQQDFNVKLGVEFITSFSVSRTINNVEVGGRKSNFHRTAALCESHRELILRTIQESAK